MATPTLNPVMVVRFVNKMYQSLRLTTNLLWPPLGSLLGPEASSTVPGGLGPVGASRGPIVAVGD